MNKISFGVRMSLRRVGWIAAVALATVLEISCGQVYRPVVLPTTTTPPNPANFHAVFGISNNAPSKPGTALQIDVSGDTNIGVENMGILPTHAAILPNNSRIFVANAGSFTGDNDVVMSFTPAVDSSTVTGLGNAVTFTLPNVGTPLSSSASITGISESGDVVTVTLSSALNGATIGGQIVISGVGVAQYNGTFPISAISGTTIQYVDATQGLANSSSGTASISIPTFCSYQPDFVATAQSNAVYVANYGRTGNDTTCTRSSTDSVAVLNISSNTVGNIAYLAAGAHPVAIAETPNAANLYVVNQGNNTVTDLSPIDLSQIGAPIPMGTTPVWAVARPDSQRVYVVTQGDGQLYSIHTDANTVDPGESVGAGANFVLYDKSHNRLFVTNPAAQAVYVFDATADPPAPLATISMSAGSAACPNGCSPVSVAALQDGSRFYVASYQDVLPCPDTNLGPTIECMIPMLTVFDAANFAVKPITTSPLAPSLSLLSAPYFAATQYAVPIDSSCAAPPIYAPGTTRFRMFTTAAADSSHVYVSICDAGTIADVVATTSTIGVSGNTPDTLKTNLNAPTAACVSASCNSVASITGYSITSNVVTFTAANSFTPGQRVAISNLTSTAGVSVLNGQNLTVIAAGLSASQFECTLSTQQTDVPPTTDAGSAVPLSPQQSPIFLLTGQ